jgi:hypothetical protein
VSTVNNNRALIDGLRQAADWLESTPDFPAMGDQKLRFFVWNDKAKLKDIARLLGSFKKTFSGQWFELHKLINDAVMIQVVTDREMVCKRVVTWECPDDASLLKLVEGADGE